MHKCINNSIGNVYHLEQFVSEFFPYSQKQLGFDQPVEIRFESDPDNAGVMLGKTAYYDPAAMEIALYVDGRHPKDVMRSLSHELVHHAQNCRGDFTGAQDTGAGYAQEDPHLRKMEREAYTKGNLIFRDFEDLIKTGKINIEIDFSDSGEPKMSLKEWKNKELNMLLMKKWGILSETKSTKSKASSAFDELDEGDLGDYINQKLGGWKPGKVTDPLQRPNVVSIPGPEPAPDPPGPDPRGPEGQRGAHGPPSTPGSFVGTHSSEFDPDDPGMPKGMQRSRERDTDARVKKESRKVTVQEARNMARRIIKRILEEGQ